MTTAEALAHATQALRRFGIEPAAREARLLMAHAQGRPVPDPSALAPKSFAGLLALRCAHEPMALIFGQKGFWSLDLQVSTATLIPRADTETLIEAALATCPDRANIRRVLDLGTGTGALLLAALCEFSAAYGLGVDRSPEACALARHNASRNGLADRASFVCGDWAGCLGEAFDLVLANPPYVETGEIPALMPEVSCYEPKSALDGGPDGLDAYRAILPDLPRLLAPGGCAVLEIGLGQADRVASLATRVGLAVACCRADLGGISRAIVLRPANRWKKPVGSGAEDH
jgi:release factor glutamine methyltransferase